MDLLEGHANWLVRFREKNRVKKILRLLDVQSTDTVVDVGCHTGNISRWIVQKCQNLIGIDLDPLCLKEAQKNLPYKNVRLIQSSIENIDLNDEISHKTLCAETLEHIENPQRGLEELLRITKPGGKIIIGVPNETMIQAIKRTLHQLGIAKMLGNLSPGLSPGHLHFFGKQKLIEIIGNRAKISYLKYSFPTYTYVFCVLEKE
jgi:ubiquinone/menaquinone biosynthesis C-methylase UbiE